MKICLYQGTFNPIHNAHLNVAKYVLEKFDVKNILFIPAYKPPHKKSFNFDKINAIHRLNMVKLAIKDNPDFICSDIEYKREKPSYTVDTIKELYRIYQLDEKPFFIIGTDAFRQIETWYNTIELKELVDFIIFTRDNNFSKDEFMYLKQKGYNFLFSDFPFYDISSTEIRKKINLEQDISDIVPLEVDKYIKENELYID